LVAVDLDLGTRLLAEQNRVARVDVRVDALAALFAGAGTNRRRLTRVRRGVPAGFGFRGAKNCHWPHAYGDTDERPRWTVYGIVQGWDCPIGLVVCSSALYLMFSQFRVAGGLAASLLTLFAASQEYVETASRCGMSPGVPQT
jgi:hypothetical protein